MKSVGEVMAIGRTFQESLQKALRGLEVGSDGFNPKVHANQSDAQDILRHELKNPGPDRIWYIADAFRFIPRHVLTPSCLYHFVATSKRKHIRQWSLAS